MIASLKPLPRLLTALALAGSFAVGAAQATVVYDNLGAAVSGADPVQSYGPLANSFSTDSSSAALASVALLLRSNSDQLPGTLSLALLADSNNAPGALLYTLGSLDAGQVSTSGFAVYSWHTSGHPALAANTRYWIGLSSSDPVAIEWAWTTDSSGTGVANEWSYSQLLGAQANSTAGGYQMAVSVPEPSSVLLLLAGLALTAGLAARRR